MNGTPQHQASWARGAEGEELVATALAARCSDEVVLLHDRRIPGGRANIDHIAIAPSGVWVIDAKRYKGKVQVVNPLFGKQTLRIAGRDRTKLVDGLSRQVEVVSNVVKEVERRVPVHGCFCFVDAELPLLTTPTINGFACVGRRGLVKRLNASGLMTAEAIEVLARTLAAAFRIA